MGPLRCLLLVLAVVALPAEDDLAATAKNDVEVRLTTADGKTARLAASNRNDYAATVTVMVSFSLDQSDEKPYTLTLPAGAHAALDQPIAIAGSTTLANLRVTAVERAAVCAASGYAQLASATRDGVTITAFTAANDASRAFLVFDNDTGRDVHVAYTWYLDSQPIVDRRLVPAHAKAGAHGEIVQHIRQAIDDRDQTNRALSIEAVIPR